MTARRPQEDDNSARLCPIYCILAAEAPIAAVFQRHSLRWWRVLQWNVNKGTVVPGAWFRGQLAPRDSSLSKCGKFLLYQARKPKRHPFWSAGRTADEGYRAISKIPWLSVLIAWRSVWISRSQSEVSWVTSHMLEQSEGVELEPRTSKVHDPDVVLNRVREGQLIRRFPRGVSSPLLPYPVHRHYAPSGWKELPASWSPVGPQKKGRELQLLGKATPTGEMTTLGFAWNREIREPGWLDIWQYFFVGTSPDDVTLLDGVNWAWWRPDGCLLTTTKYGDLQVREVSGSNTSVIWTTNIRAQTPDPQPPPEWAKHL